MKKVVSQDIKPPRVKPLKGMLMIALIFVGILVLNLLSTVLISTTGAVYLQLLPWLVCFGFGYWLIKTFLLGYCYTLRAGTVYLERMIGTHSKLVDTFPLTDVVEFQRAERVLKNHPEVKKPAHLVRSEIEYEKMGCLYRKGGALKIAVLQPNEEMRMIFSDEERRAQAAEASQDTALSEP